MSGKLLAELLKSNDNLQVIEFKLFGEDFKWHFKYLTLLEKVRIEQMCIKPVSTIAADGAVTVKHEKQDHLIPIHTILEKALDEDGKKIFSHTNPEDFKAISALPATLASRIAYQLSVDVFGTMEAEDE